MFSCHDSLDRVIHSHPELRERFRKATASLLRDRLTVAYLSEALRSVLTLRNRLDDGLPAGDQDAARRIRTEVVEDHIQRLSARHAELTAIASRTPESRPQP